MLQMADLFVYQPISLKHGVFTTEIDPATGKHVPESVLTYLRPTCVRISFPYMYNNAFWPLVNRPYKTAVNTESIPRLLSPAARSFILFIYSLCYSSYYSCNFL